MISIRSRQHHRLHENDGTHGERQAEEEGGAAAHHAAHESLRRGLRIAAATRALAKPPSASKTVQERITNISTGYDWAIDTRYAIGAT
jgi:hypothetical protein